MEKGEMGLNRVQFDFRLEKISNWTRWKWGNRFSILSL